MLVNCSRFFTKLESLLQQIRSLQKKIKEKEEEEPIVDLPLKKKKMKESYTPCNICVP